MQWLPRSGKFVNKANIHRSFITNIYCKSSSSFKSYPVSVSSPGATERCCAISVARFGLLLGVCRPCSPYWLPVEKEGRSRGGKHFVTITSFHPNYAARQVKGHGDLFNGKVVSAETRTCRCDYIFRFT